MSKNAKKTSSGQRQGLPKTGPKLVDQLQPSAYFKLSDCGTKYLDSLLDPFNGPVEACIPKWPSFPSQKLRVFSRGSLQVGTAGVGFLLARPSIASDVVTGTHSLSTYAGTTMTSTTGATVVADNPNSPYNNASFASAVGALAQRLVSFGIRVRYAGTELNRGGTMYVLEEPDHLDLNGMNSGNLLAWEKCHRLPVTEEWTQLCTLPVTEAETEYWAGANAPNPNGQSANTAYFLGILIQSTSGNAFDYEIFGNYEVVGSLARGKTRSDTDEVGTSVVFGALRSTNDGQVDRRLMKLEDTGRKRGSTLGSIMKAVGNYAVKELSGVVPQMLKGAAMMAPLLLA